MKKVILSSLLFGLLVTTSCTQSIGPYVRNVQVDRDNQLVVERCVISISQATSSLSADQCTVEKHQIR